MWLTATVQTLRSFVYDVLIVGMTKVWNREVLLRVPIKSNILDVGIGTATGILASRDLIVSKELTIIGVDYDDHYIDAAKASAKKCSLEKEVQLVHASIHDYQGGPFDAVYFSGSFMILPDQVAALRHCVAMLRDENSKIYFTQTFEAEGFIGRVVTPYVKRMLKALLTIDFGTVTFEKEFRETLAKAEVNITEFVMIHHTPLRAQVLVVAQPHRAPGKRE